MNIFQMNLKAQLLTDSRHNKTRHCLLILIVVILSVMIWQSNVVIFPIGFVRQRISKEQKSIETKVSCKWRKGSLVEKPCYSKRLVLNQRNILFVGDSVTRYVYFGLVQTLCGYTGCESLPRGGVGYVHCYRHSTIQPETGFRMKYIWHRHINHPYGHPYGASPNKILSKPKEPIDIVYWQSGLWLKKENKTSARIKQEYSTIINEARFLCELNAVKHFYVVDTMANLKGRHGNLGSANLNRLLSQQWTAANLTRRELQCLHRLNYRSCVVHDWQHIQKDRVHPTVKAAASMAPWVWAELGMGGHALLPCDTPTVEDWKPKNTTKEWCAQWSLTVLKHKHRGE